MASKPSKPHGLPEAKDAIPNGSLKPKGTPQTDGKNSRPKSFETDPATLTTLMELVQNSAQANVVDDERSEKELEELLKQMDEANVLADGIEGRVDALLAGLEEMLGSLDAGDNNEECTHDSSHNSSAADAHEAAHSPLDCPNHQAGR